MERSDYLKLCQKHAMEEPKKVTYKGVSYYPIEYILSFDKLGRALHSVVLHDINANSTIRVRLRDIEE